MNGPAHEPVRELHDEAAGDANLAVASVRPLGTTRFELWLLARDVLRKADIDPSVTVLEIGCGVGVVGLPAARRARRYVGIDIAETALDVFHKRLAKAGISDARATLCAMDFVAAPDRTVESLGRFDRIIAYAVLHYVADETEGQIFVARALASLERGGRALFGNLPLEDLREEVEAPSTSSRKTLGRAATSLCAALSPSRPNAVGVSDKRRTRLTNLVFERARLWLRALAPGARTAPRSLPPGTTLQLSRDGIERWLEKCPVAIHWRWLPPRAATPLAKGRADLLIIRDA